MDIFSIFHVWKLIERRKGEGRRSVKGYGTYALNKNAHSLHDVVECVAQPIKFRLGGVATKNFEYRYTPSSYMHVQRSYA